MADESSVGESGTRFSYRFRLYPNKEQERFFAVNFGCCRFVYNHFLSKRIEAYERTRKTVKRPKIVEGTEDEWERNEEGKVVYEEIPNESYDPKARPMTFFDTSRALTTLKKEVVDEDGRAWLYDADASALVYSLRNLDKAYKNFFRGLKTGQDVGFPQFKKRGGRQSYTTQKCSVEEKHVVLPKAGRVKARVHRKVEGEIVSATVSKDARGEYYISINVKNAPVPSAPAPESGAVGFTYGVSHWAVASDGEVFDLPEQLKRLEKRLDREKRKLSRRKGGRKGEKKSGKYERQRMVVAVLEGRIANIRAAATHEFTRQIVNEHSAIASREMASKDMVGSSNNALGLPRNARRALNRRVAAGNFYEVNRQLAYKAEWAGREFALVSSDTPTAQTCSRCGHVEKSLAGNLRQKWTCPECGEVHNRKANGALNVLDEGLKMMREQKEAGE